MYDLSVWRMERFRKEIDGLCAALEQIKKTNGSIAQSYRNLIEYIEGFNRRIG